MNELEWNGMGCFWSGIFEVLDCGNYKPEGSIVHCGSNSEGNIKRHVAK